VNFQKSIYRLNIADRKSLDLSQRETGKLQTSPCLHPRQDMGKLATSRTYQWGCHGFVAELSWTSYVMGKSQVDIVEFGLYHIIIFSSALEMRFVHSLSTAAFHPTIAGRVCLSIPSHPVLQSHCSVKDSVPLDQSLELKCVYRIGKNVSFGRLQLLFLWMMKCISKLLLVTHNVVGVTGCMFKLRPLHYTFSWHALLLISFMHCGEAGLGSEALLLYIFIIESYREKKVIGLIVQIIKCLTKVSWHLARQKALMRNIINTVVHHCSPPRPTKSTGLIVNWLKTSLLKALAKRTHEMLCFYIYYMYIDVYI